MRNRTNIISNKKAKTKKALGGIVGTIITIIAGIAIFSEGAFLGTIFGIGILAVVTAGVYFWLKAIDELPDSF